MASLTVLIESNHSQTEKMLSIKRLSKNTLPIPTLIAWITPLTLVGVLLNMFANPAYFLVPHLISFATVPINRSTFLVGDAFSPASLGLQFLTHVHLGDNWSSKFETKAQQQLVTDSVYSRVRHPMYCTLHSCWLRLVVAYSVTTGCVCARFQQCSSW